MKIKPLKKLEVTAFEKECFLFEELYGKLVDDFELINDSTLESMWQTYDNDGCSLEQLRGWNKKLKERLSEEEELQAESERASIVYDLESYGDTYVFREVTW